MAVEREAMVFVPKDAESKRTPIVFFFHGRNGKMDQVARQHPIHKHWPEAIVVFPQGLPSKSLKGKGDNPLPGWQVMEGQDGDRDLRFFDAMLTSLQGRYLTDDRRIYVTGTSNGAGITYLLWDKRGDAFAAVCPSCTAARILSATDGGFDRIKKIPSLHIAGTNDETIRFEDQMKTIDAVRNARKCSAPQPWGDPPVEGATLYPSGEGGPVVVYVYNGGHGLPKNASSIIVQFFKQHSKP